MHLSEIVCRLHSFMCKHVTITHFSQISLWNTECKDVLQSLSWHYVLFISFYILSLLLKTPLFLYSYRVSWVYSHTIPLLTKPDTLKNSHQQNTQFESRNEIQLHHQMSGWACKTSVSHSSKNWKAGQSRWSSSEWVTETAYSIHKY